ncbi:LLM class F420-dependent oxidoreductase [Ktedonobacter sp. SOSP1-52]|uniref:TIGR03621 family F420-dependent LLM class oxidoreductase n=1 Tax=Ktedonobacter sp. SOSP1-52 TaxID=2778366 RepID=UPI0019162D6C|nr:TIGR03621 family F420-dependent LLM class oxidoreductase [Ktedonobacter sp. SOSP1-52]GHO65452.1 LLM class F420-dependent oxidoreductase [Ktedonobacter sp. SOSP1-52]
MGKQRRFRFGVVAAHVQSRAAWIAKARKVEDLGYDTLLVVDHLTAGLGPLVALTVAAEATKTIRVGTFVLCNDFRHPAVLAKEIATLDVLSEGRFEFGLGAGYLPTDYRKSGLSLDAPGTRVSRFEEAIHVMKKLFTEEATHFQGDYYTIADLQGTPQPLQKPHPPFYIGGGGKRVLSFAAREADIVGIAHKSSAHGLDLANTTTEPTAQKIAWVREAAGERFEHLELSAMIFRVVVTDQREGVAQQVGARFGLTGEQALSSVQLLIGTTQQIAEVLWERREHFGLSYIVINEEQMDAFAPVITLLAEK